MSDLFDRAFAFLIPHEGIDADHPADGGGRTRYGISHTQYPLEDIENLTLDRAKYLYERDYWIKTGFDEIRPERVAIKVFDFGVVAGPQRSGKALQDALNSLGAMLKIDGQVGPKTLAACVAEVKKRGEGPLLAQLCGYQWEHFEGIARGRLSQRVFTPGWSVRAHDLPD